MDACLLIKCTAGRFRDVAKGVSELEGVKRVFATIGRWDVVAHVSTEDVRSLSKICLKVHGMHGVESIETLLSF